MASILTAATAFAPGYRLGSDIWKYRGKISECDLKLVDIDSEHLGIPNSTYDAAVHMSSVRFQKTVRDLQQISDSGTTLAVIECTKEGIKFSCEGEAGKGGITLKAGGSVNSEDDSPVIELQTGVAMNSPSNVPLTSQKPYLCQIVSA